MKYNLTLLIIISILSTIEAKEPISAGFIQFYNNELTKTIKTFEESKKNNIKLIILQFTKWDNILVNYDKDKILRWSKTNNMKIIVGLTGRGSPINALHRDHSTYWKTKVDDVKITKLIREDMNIVSDWPIKNRYIDGFYSTYEPLSTLYEESVGREYDEYLLGLSNKLEEWAEQNNRDVLLAFSGAVGRHSSDTEYDRSRIKDRAKKFSRRVSKIAKQILLNKSRLKLIFILQDGSGVRQISDEELAIKVRPFFIEVRNELKTINNIEFWPLIEAFDKVGDKTKYISKNRLKHRLDNISNLGWSGETDERYRIVVFDLPSYNQIQ